MAAGIPVAEFWGLTPRQYLVVTRAAADARYAGSLQVAWITAKLMRAQKIPPLKDLMPRPPRTAEEAAAEMRASMSAYRQIAAERGKIRSWKEWRH